MNKELLEAEIEKLKIACAIWARVNRQKYLECKARKEMLEKKLAEIKELEGELKKFKENINAERRGGINAQKNISKNNVRFAAHKKGTGGI
jgi:hypothetical protein